MIQYTAECICGHVTAIPPTEEWRNEREKQCDNPNCDLLDKCRNCQYRYFLTRYCNCDCGRCTIISFHESEVSEGNGADFGLIGVSRIPKDQRWNPALGEYCRTTGEVEKHRKKQGKVYVSDDEAPKPYEPSTSKESKRKRREFAKKACNVEIKTDE